MLTMPVVSTVRYVEIIILGYMAVLTFWKDSGPKKNTVLG